jgi:hypothetical protein
MKKIDVETSMPSKYILQLSLLLLLLLAHHYSPIFNLAEDPIRLLLRAASIFSHSQSELLLNTQ